MILCLGNVRCDSNTWRILLLATTTLHHRWLLWRRVHRRRWLIELIKTARGRHLLSWLLSKASSCHTSQVLSGLLVLTDTHILSHVLIVNLLIRLLILFHPTFLLLIELHLLLELTAVLILTADFLGHLRVLIVMHWSLVIGTRGAGGGWLLLWVARWIVWLWDVLA